MVTRNLNRIIDINYYPVETAERSNMRHRPIGIGVQGLADTFILLGEWSVYNSIQFAFVISCLLWYRVQSTNLCYPAVILLGQGCHVCMRALMYMRTDALVQS